MARRCHILEGTNAGSTIAYMACGRALPYPGNIGDYIGRAWILKGTWVSSVTCMQCRKKYKLAPYDAPKESTDT